MEFNTIVEVRVLQDLMIEFGGHVNSLVKSALRLIIKMMSRALSSVRDDETINKDASSVRTGTIVVSEEA